LRLTAPNHLTLFNSSEVKQTRRQGVFLTGTTATELIPRENEIQAQPTVELPSTKLGYPFHSNSIRGFQPVGNSETACGILHPLVTLKNFQITTKL